MIKLFLISVILLTQSALGAYGPSTVLFSGAMTGTSVLHSTAIDCLNLSLASFEANWTGTPNGTIIIEGSNDNSVWTNIGASGWTNPAGTAAGALIAVTFVSWRFVRLTYTNASSTGTLTVVGMAK